MAHCVLTLSAGTGGTAAVTAGSATGTCGRSITVTASPNSGYHFVQWSNGVTSNPYTFTINSNESLSAQFATNAPPTYFVNAVVLPSGSNAGTVSGSASGIPSGTSWTVSESPNAGHTFNNWTDLSGSVVSTNSSYTFTVVANTTLFANFI